MKHLLTLGWFKGHWFPSPKSFSEQWRELEKFIYTLFMVKSPVLNLVGDGWTHTLWKMDIYIYCIYIYVICISHIINNLNMPFGWYFKLIFVWHFRLWVGLRIDILAPVVLQMNPVDFWRATCSLAGRDGHVVTHLWWRREIFEHWIIASPIWNWVDEFILSILYIYIYIYIWKNKWEFRNPLAHMMPAHIC